MAFVDALVSVRPPGYMSYDLQLIIGKAVMDTVGPVIYGSRYPEDAAVDVRSGYATLDTYAALTVGVDSEDLPREGWLITGTGLLVPPDSDTKGLTVVREVGNGDLTDELWVPHARAQARAIHDAFIKHEIWESGVFHWEGSGKDVEHKLGVLVARVSGGWHASYSEAGS